MGVTDPVGVFCWIGDVRWNYDGDSSPVEWIFCKAAGELEVRFSTWESEDSTVYDGDGDRSMF